MVSAIDRLVDHPSYKLVTYTTGTIWDINRDGPIVSCGYREVFPSCTAIAMLDRERVPGLAHISPFDNGVSIGSSMCQEYLRRMDIPQDISAIVTGTDAEHIRQIADFFERIAQVRTKAYPLKPNKGGVIDMGIDPDTEQLLIHRRFSGENISVDFWPQRNELTPLIEERVSELLEKPYAGTKAFRINHPDARYVSNCHGAMVYVFGLKEPSIKEKNHPTIIAGDKMQKLIDKYFLQTDKPEIGSLVCFYEDSKHGQSLIHSALVTGPEGLILHQGGTGGRFEPSSIKDKLRSFSEIKGLEVKSYRFKP